MWKNQIFYHPTNYGQYTGELLTTSNHILTNRFNKQLVLSNEANKNIEYFQQFTVEYSQSQIKLSYNLIDLSIGVSKQDLKLIPRQTLLIWMVSYQKE